MPRRERGARGGDFRPPGAGGSVASALGGLAPDGDGTIGLNGGKGARAAEDIHVTGARRRRCGIAPLGGAAPHGDGPIGFQGREGVQRGEDLHVTGAGGRAGAATGGGTPGPQ